MARCKAKWIIYHNNELDVDHTGHAHSDTRFPSFILFLNSFSHFEDNSKSCVMIQSSISLFSLRNVPKSLARYSNLRRFWRPQKKKRLCRACDYRQAVSPRRQLIFTAYLIRHDCYPDMVFTVLQTWKASQSRLISKLVVYCRVQSQQLSSAQYSFIYNAVMILTTRLRSILSSVSCLSVSFHPSVYFFLLCSVPFSFLPTLFCACLSLLSFNWNTNEYASSPKHNLTPFVCYHIPSALLLSHTCYWFYFVKKPEEETALIFPQPLSSLNQALFVFNYCPW